MSIYWIEGPPNPWVQGIAIGALGAYYFFYEFMAPPHVEWTGLYGKCGEDESGRLYE